MACKKIDLSIHQDLVKLARREIDTWVKVSHGQRNIAQFSNDASIDSTSGMLRLYMEYYPGGDLSRLLSRLQYEGSQLHPVFAMAACLCTTSAIDHCHKNDILHRDIKPANVLMTHSLAEINAFYWACIERKPYSELAALKAKVRQHGWMDGCDLSSLFRVTDFGLAKFATNSLNTQASYSLLGTPGYIAAECLGSSGTFSEMSDVYALGMFCYEVMTGSSPHSFAGSSITLPERYSPEVADIIYRCLSTDPYSRPSLQELYNCFDSEGTTMLDGAEFKRINERVAEIREPSIAASCHIM
jgi:serine/threonine-protein kinase